MSACSALSSSWVLRTGETEFLSVDSCSRVNPQFIKRLDCSFVHGKLGGPGLCEVNAARRWSRGLLDALAIYLPVHTLSSRSTSKTLF